MKAAVVVGRVQAQVVAQGAGVGVAVGIELSTRWKLREHGGLDAGNLLQQGDGPGAQARRRGHVLPVPLEVEALPAVLEEGVEARVVVLLGSLDGLEVLQRQGFVPDLLPAGGDLFQLRKIMHRQVGLGRHLGGDVEEDVDGRHQRRMVEQLSPEAVAGLSPEMHPDDRRKEERDDSPLHTNFLMGPADGAENEIFQ